MKIQYLIIIFFGIIFLGTCSGAKAETTVQLHTVSYHSNRAANYNEQNYGVGIRHYVDTAKPFSYATVGTYTNSERNTSTYVGIGWEWAVSVAKVGVSTGLITGYSTADVIPYVVFNIRYSRVTVVISPFIEPVLHVTVDLLTF